jgi:hypothetical protein
MAREWALAKGLRVQICPARDEKELSTWARYDGSEGEIVALEGHGTKLRVRVRIEGEALKGQVSFPRSVIKAVV